MRAPHRIFSAAVVVMSLGVATDARAQHEGQQISAAASAPPNARCAEGGQKALGIVEAASRRIETARPGNSAADVKAAMADLQTAVAAAQAELFICRAALPAAPVAAMPAGGMAGMDHSTMAMGAPPAGVPVTPGAKPADVMAGMDHF